MKIFSQGMSMFAAVVSMALCIGCSDRDLVAADPRFGPAHGGARFVAEFVCEGTVRSAAVNCRASSPATPGVERAVLGSTQVKLRSSNVVYNSSTWIFSFDVMMQNLLGEPIGTPDGTTIVGSKVFFYSGPTVTAYVAPGDTGTITVNNADGKANFTGPNQPYFLYQQILQPQDSTPKKRWELKIPPAVSTFSFQLKVFTPLASEPQLPVSAPDSLWISEDSIVAIRSLGRAVMVNQRMSGPYPPDVIIVKFQPTASQEERQAAMNTVNASPLGGVAPFYYLQIATQDSTGAALWSAIDKLRSLPQVVYAAPDVYMYQTNYLRPNDGPYWKSSDWQIDPDSARGETWGPEAIAAPLAWGCEVGNDSTPVAIVDILQKHMLTVASILGERGNDSVGITGVMWRSKLTATVAAGVPTTQDLHLEQDLIRAVAAGNVAINISLGASYLQSKSSTAPRLPVEGDTADAARAAAFGDKWRNWMQEAESRNPGMHPLYVIAAGNFKMDAKWSGIPQLATDSVLGSRIIVVAASDSNRIGPKTRSLWAASSDPLERGSDFGSLVSIVAPGHDVIGIAGTSVNASVGTSYAAPYVAGVAGLLKAFDPRLTGADLKNLIVQGAVNGGYTAGGYPYLNGYEALKLAAARSGAPLCGSRVWWDGDAMKVQRASTAETLFTVPAGDWFTDFQVLHGGKRIRYTDRTTGAEMLATWSPQGWTEAPLGSDPAGNEDAPTYLSRWGVSHDGDSTSFVLQWGSPANWELHIGNMDGTIDTVIASGVFPENPGSSNGQCLRTTSDDAPPYPNCAAWGVNETLTATEMAPPAYAPRGDRVFAPVNRTREDIVVAQSWYACPGQANPLPPVYEVCRDYTTTYSTVDGYIMSVAINGNTTHQYPTQSGVILTDVAIADGTDELVLEKSTEHQTFDYVWQHSGSGWQIVSGHGDAPTQCVAEYRDLNSFSVLFSRAGCGGHDASFSPNRMPELPGGLSGRGPRFVRGYLPPTREAARAAAWRSIRLMRAQRRAAAGHGVRD